MNFEDLIEKMERVQRLLDDADKILFDLKLSYIGDSVVDARRKVSDMIEVLDCEMADAEEQQ